jgi:hypothetical protein
MDKVTAFFNKVTSKLSGKKQGLTISDPKPATVTAITNLLPTTSAISDKNFEALIDIMYTTAYESKGVPKDDVALAVRQSLDEDRH